MAAAEDSVIVLLQVQSDQYAESTSAWFMTDAPEAQSQYSPVYRKMSAIERDLYKAPRTEGSILHEDLLRCCCTACWSPWSATRNCRSETHARSARRNLANRHCMYCKCKDCVCDFKRDRGFYNSYYTPADGYFDNECGGFCILCERFK